MKTVPSNLIRVPLGRQRTEIDDASLGELISSIRNLGILQPIVIRQTSEGPTLVAGERRLRAIEAIALLGGGIKAFGQVLPEGHAPVTDIGTLDPISAFEAELEENIRRVDLSWQDRIAAESRLMDLRKAQAKVRGEPPPTFADIGQEIAPGKKPDGEYGQREMARQAILLTKNMHMPEIAKASTQKEAWKILQRKEQEKEDEIRGQTIGRQAVSSLFSVWNEDCRTWLPRCIERYDCILIDPPYGMGADSFGDGGGKLAGITHQYDDDRGRTLSLLSQIAPELFTVGKSQSHLYLWCDIDLFREIREIMAAAGWWVHRTPLINIKREGGRVPWPEHGPRRCYELVLYAVKGKRPITAIYRDTFESSLERDSDGHGAAKPVEAYVDLLKRSCRPGDSVLDCFAGTGTIIAAAAQLKLRATAVELDPQYYGQCLRRLQALSEKEQK